MTQEALKLALEALEGFYEYGYDRQECFEHITAIKEALADHIPDTTKMVSQPEREPVAWADHGVVNWIVDKQFKHASYLYEGPPPAPSKACVYCGQLVIKEKNT